MSIHQIHFGRKFYLDNQKGYWNSTDSPRIFAHRWVWINHYGSIPKGCHIHHKDRNKSNNFIENLELMTRASHLSLHGKDVEKVKHAREMANKYRPLTKEWHASSEGKAWHKLHAIKYKFGNWNPKEYTCELCDKKYLSKKRSRSKFCTNACKSAWRRKEGFDDIVKTCSLCQKTFKANKYRKSEYCGRSCGCKARWNRSKQIPSN